MHVNWSSAVSGVVDAWLAGGVTANDGGEPTGLAELLAEHSEEVAELTRRLRAVIRKAHPELTEKIYVGWHGLGFRHPDKGYVAAVFPREHDAQVGFEHGADLPDPYGLLQGGGRQVRYLSFRPDDASPTDDQLVEYLDLALSE